MQRVSDVLKREALYTFSWWGTFVGFGLAAVPVTRRAGAVLLLLVGYGGVGVAWERTCSCDLRRLRRPPREAAVGVVTHVPQLLVGHLALARSR